MPRQLHRFALLCVLVLTACSLPSPIFQVSPPTPTPSTSASATPTVAVALDQTIRMERGGFVLRYPAGWVTRELSETLELAANVDALERQLPGKDLVITIDSTPLATVASQYGDAATTDPNVLFDVSSGSAVDAGYEVNDTAAITIDAMSGVAADLSTSSGAGQLVVLLTPTQAVRVLGQAAPDAWAEQRPLFAALLDNLEFFDPAAQPTPTPTGLASQPQRTTSGPEGFILRLGGSGGPEARRFASARGLAVAPSGELYMAESNRGIWVFEPDGTFVTTFGEAYILDAYDVVRTIDGRLYVADYGRNAIAEFDANGTFVGRWGSAGNEPDQFGLSSPQRIALGSDDSIYALDTRIADDGSSAVSSIVRFNAQDRSVIERIALPPEAAPADLAVDIQGNIYLAETFSGTITKLDPQGQVVAELGGGVVEGGIVAGAIDLDREGNIYVATWNAGVLKLAPSGILVARGGSIAEPGSIPRPGEFSLPNGIAAAPGGVVWVSDNSGEYSAVTALQLDTDEAAQATAAAQAASATPIPDEALLRQWAAEAEASSEYDPNYSAENMLGPPDVEGCRDDTNAWASLDPQGLETVTLTFDEPVFATGVDVYQNHQPGFITKIELTDERGEVSTIYERTPSLQSECPYVLRSRFSQSLYRVNTVTLTVDQRSGANWSEIDAVELVGLP